MKSSRAALVATAIPLLLTSLRVTAGELPFNAPLTEQAKERAPLLHSTAQALHDSSSAATLRLLGGQQIANLWLFPTADANTVFARYTLTSNREADAIEPATEHLTVLTVRENRVVDFRELTSAATELVSKERPRLDWTAAIGTGDAARAGLTHLEKTSVSSDRTSAYHVAPPALHWTASIGTGAAAASTTATVRDTKQPSTSQPAVAAAHWTSRIGRGDAFDSSRPVVYASLAKVKQ